MSVAPDRLNVLLLGTGGREHALAWAMRKSPRLGDLWIEPGANAGLAELGTPCPETFDRRRLFYIERWLDRQNIGLVVIGPEGPLAEGWADALAGEGRRVFGPCQAAAHLESDKAWAKQVMRQAAVPTAEGRAFHSIEQAVRYVTSREDPLVIKAAGLAQGKGVVVCDTRDEALDAIERIMEKREFGEAGARVVIEERLEGQEISVLALVDGSTICVLDPCQDHKRVGEGDTGPNTGGMGAYCPTPAADPDVMRIVERDVLVPTVDALRRDGIEYRGILYAGLILTPGGPKVLEFNCRFGDPETQALMARFQGDLVEVLWACAGGELDRAEFSLDPRPSCCVVVCSEGYPGAVTKGRAISGIDQAQSRDGVVVFQAGTARSPGGELVTNGGRVLAVTAVADTLRQAQAAATEAAGLIQFQGAHFRRDIAHRALHPSPARS